MIHVCEKVVLNKKNFSLNAQYNNKNNKVSRVYQSKLTMIRPEETQAVESSHEIKKYVNEEKFMQYRAECHEYYEDCRRDLVDKPAPYRNRSCTDIWCLVLFISLFIAFAVYSLYSIYLIMQLGFTELDQGDNVTFLKEVSQSQFERLGKTVASCISGSVGISLILLISLKCCPQTTIGFMSFITVLTIAAAGLTETQEQRTQQNTGMSAYFFGLALSYASFIFKFWDNISKAAILMRTVGNFINQNLKILLLPFLALLFCAVILFMWVGGFYSFCVRYSHGYLQFEDFIVLFVFWVFCLIFFNFFFYYTSVFLTANAIAIWFLNKKEFGIVSQPYRFIIRYHLGTIAFASLAITFSKLMKLAFFIAKLQNTQNQIFSYIGKFVNWIVAFCTGSIEAIVEVLNNYSIIICSLTGQSLMDSAKIVGDLFLNDNEEVFSDFTYTTYIINVGGVLTVSIIPTLVGSILLQNINGPLWALSVMMIYFTSSMIGLLMLQFFVESASTLFLLYILDGKLSKDGFKVRWNKKLEQDLQDCLGKAFSTKLERKSIVRQFLQNTLEDTKQAFGKRNDPNSADIFLDKRVRDIKEKFGDQSQKHEQERSSSSEEESD